MKIFLCNRLIFFFIFQKNRGVAISDVLLSILCVYGATTIIKNAKAGFFVILGVFLTTFDMLGLTFLSNSIFSGFDVKYKKYKTFLILYVWSL